MATEAKTTTDMGKIDTVIGMHPVLIRSAD
jgi:hypothetical protein